MLIGASLWVLAVLGASQWVWSYKTRPGDAGRIPSMWPEDARLARTYGQPTLLIFIHPECLCSRATLHELGRLLTSIGGRVGVHALFLSPAERTPGWERGTNWDIATDLPGVKVLADEGGAIALRFGVRTSGHALLYDRDGVLRFSGGITPARAHEGSNTGREQIKALVLRGNAEAPTAPVFGCALETTDEAR